jgi:hypothetical protein
MVLTERVNALEAALIPEAKRRRVRPTVFLRRANGDGGVQRKCGENAHRRH